MVSINPQKKAWAWCWISVGKIPLIRLSIWGEFRGSDEHANEFKEYLWGHSNQKEGTTDFECKLRLEGSRQVNGKLTLKWMIDLVSVGYDKEFEAELVAEVQKVVCLLPAPIWVLCDDIVPFFGVVSVYEHLQGDCHLQSLLTSLGIYGSKTRRSSMTLILSPDSFRVHKPHEEEWLQAAWKIIVGRGYQRRVAEVVTWNADALKAEQVGYKLCVRLKPAALCCLKARLRPKVCEALHAESEGAHLFVVLCVSVVPLLCKLDIACRVFQASCPVP